MATPVPELKKLRARSSGHANAERRAWMLDAALSDATSEFRVSTNTTSGTIVTGQAIVYGVRTIIHDRFGKFGETIKRGAAGHLLKGDVRLLFDHDGLPLGRTISTTLALNETASGVNFAAYLDDTAPLAQNVLSGIRRGDLSGCSFAFAVNEAFDQWNAAMTERTITRFASIPEVSVVTFPRLPDDHRLAGRGSKAGPRPQAPRDSNHARAHAPQRRTDRRPHDTDRHAPRARRPERRAVLDRDSR